MADEPVADPLDEQTDEEGGPVKSFLEHLEDLRWVLIKCCSAVGVAMLVCLLGGNYVIKVLKWPLDRAPADLKWPVKGGSGKQAAGPQRVRVLIGTNQLSVLTVTTNDPLAGLLGTNHFVRLSLTPVIRGTNQSLEWTAQEDVDALLEPALPVQIRQYGPAGAFIVATKVAFYGGLLIAAPFIFYFVAHFVFPALRLREKKYIYRGLVFASGLFITGVCFCYFVLLPWALTASVQYAQWLGFTADQWRAEDYVGFVCKFLIGMGLGFELPVVVLTLVKIGVLSYRTLAKGRPYVIIICAVLGAILTTPEVITQILMAVPLYCLYEVCVWIAWYWERQDKKREAAAEAAEAVRQV
jgi:sec-independent protein translocase protein TatC